MCNLNQLEQHATPILASANQLSLVEKVELSAKKKHDQNNQGYLRWTSLKLVTH